MLSSQWLRELVGRVGTPQPAESPFETLTVSRLQRDLERALATLPENYREVVLLVAIEHLTPSEAASVLGVSPEAASAAALRARALQRFTAGGAPPAAQTLTPTWLGWVEAALLAMFVVSYAAWTAGELAELCDSRLGRAEHFAE